MVQIKTICPVPDDFWKGGGRILREVLYFESSCHQNLRKLFCRVLGQNNPYGCALAKDAFRFDPAAVQLGDVFYDG
jgi:hypothetical protein